MYLGLLAALAADRPFAKRYEQGDTTQMKRTLSSVMIALLVFFAAGVFAQDDDTENLYGIDIETAELIEDNPAEYYGETVTVDGIATNIVDANTFTLTDTEPFDLTPATFYVVDSTGQSFTGSGEGINEGMAVRVTGTLQEAVVTDLEEGFDFDLDDALWNEFAAEGDNFALVAESATMIDAVGGGSMSDDAQMAQDGQAADPGLVNSDAVFGVYDERCSAAYAGEGFLGLEIEQTELIEDNPADFFGTMVTIEGYVEQVLGNNTFLVQDNEPFDFTPPEFVVADAQGDQFGDVTLTEGTQVCVTGTVYDLEGPGFEGELGYDLDDDLFDFPAGEDQFAMVAQNVSVLDAEGTVVEREPVYGNEADFFGDESLLAEDPMVEDDETDTTGAAGTAIEQAAGNYEELCSAAYAGENFLGLDTEVTELIEDNPEEFFGTTVTIEGYIEQVFGTNGFLVQDNEPFDFTPPEFAVADAQGDQFGGMLLEEGTQVCVTGVVYDLELDRPGFENALGYELDNDFFEFPAGEDQFALVAEDVRILDE